MTDGAVTRIGLISNPNSGHNRDQFDRIEKMIAACGRVRHLITNSRGEIASALGRLADENIDVLAINGGDGTVSAILGHALENSTFSSLPAVVLLPAGTANMSATDIGGGGRLLPAVRRFCDWAQSAAAPPPGSHTQRRLMRVQLGAGSDVHYGMFLGMGAVIQGTEYAHREIHSRGLRDDLSGALGVARTVWGLARSDPRFAQPIDVTLNLDGSPSCREYSAMIVAVSTLGRLFMGIKPFWGQGPGALRLTLIEENSYRFLSTFISIARGKPNRHATERNGYLSHNADGIAIQMQGNLNLDGEILTSEHRDHAVRITPSPPVTFIRP